MNIFNKSGDVWKFKKQVIKICQYPNEINILNKCNVFKSDNIFGKIRI